MASTKSKPTQTLQARLAQRYGYLVSLAARRGYSQRALEALFLSAVAADTANAQLGRKAVRRG